MSHDLDLATVWAFPATGCPRHWPDDRFDVVWVLDQAGDGAPWTFAQVPQRLLAGDRARAIDDDPA